MKLSRLIMMGLIATFMSTPSFADGHAKVAGFFDAQYNWKNSAPEGFVVNDGAIYLKAEMENGSAMVDIPFMWTGAGGSFALGGSKAQAYLSYKYDNGFSWSLGQWDSTYRRVRLDTKDIFFARAGLVNQALDTTHTGLMVKYMFTEAVALSAQASNNGNSTTIGGNGNYDFGGQLTYMMNSIAFGVGYIFNDGANDRLHAMFNFDGGMFGLGLDFLLSTPETGDSTIGIGTQAMYDLSDTCGLGVRFDFISKPNGGATLDSQFGLTPGLKTAMTKDIDVKLDYTLFSNSPVGGGSSSTSHEVNVAGVYKF